MGVGGGGVGFAKEASKKNRAVDILRKTGTYYTPPPVIALLLTAPPLDQLTKWYILNFDQANKT